jgi:hypothetical protein
MRPNGWRSNGPYFVRIPGDQCAIEQPRVHGSFHHGVSMISAGDPARGPKRSTIAARSRRRRSPASSASYCSAIGPNVNEASTPGLPAAGDESIVTSDADFGPAD